MRHGIFSLWLCILPLDAEAGPWLRAEGAGFASVSSKLDQDLGSDHSLYAEYGLRSNLTLGAKLEAKLRLNRLSDPQALIFLRQPLGPRNGKVLYAYDIGAGLREGAPFGRLGLSLGRGLNWGTFSGWAVLDTSVDIGADPVFKADATLGLSLDASWKVMLQAFLNHEARQTELTLAPSVIWQPKGKGPSYQLSVEFKERQTALRLGLWTEF